jgi:hypothetical protein
MDGEAGRRYGAAGVAVPGTRRWAMPLIYSVLAVVSLLGGRDWLPGTPALVELATTGMEARQVFRLLGYPPIITVDVERCKYQSGPPNLIYVYPSLGVKFELDKEGKVRSVCPCSPQH